VGVVEFDIGWSGEGPLMWWSGKAVEEALVIKTIDILITTE
jgi:hypothetical protein